MIVRESSRKLKRKRTREREREFEKARERGRERERVKGEERVLARRVCTEVGKRSWKRGWKKAGGLILILKEGRRGREGGGRNTCARGRGAERRLIIQFQDSHYLRPLARSRSSGSFASTAFFHDFSLSPLSAFFPFPAKSWWILLMALLHPPSTLSAAWMERLISRNSIRNHWGELRFTFRIFNF